ncbi:glutamine synthetase, partial [Lecanoromycetidae sp. Uapishka_2]
MEELIKAIDSTPIIDHHAHNLLTASNVGAHQMMAITSEATGSALEHTPSTLAHIRAVNGLAEVLEYIGEVFPMVSQDGQEKIIREALELCPSEKLTWSTDGHWFPETYLLAVDQVREGMRQVLCDTATPRMRMLPIKQALKMFSAHKSIGITKAVLGLLQVDMAAPGFKATGEYSLYPRLEGLRLGTRANIAIVQCEFQEKETNDEVFICPRTLLRRQVEKAASHGIEYLVGFEVEIVFMSRKKADGGFIYGDVPVNEGGHSWSNARALQNDDLMDFFEKIFKKLENAGLELQQFHPESSPGQYEFIFGPLPPLQAVDALLAAREIIIITAANAGMRATLIPKPKPETCGTGAHMHISMTPSKHWKSFYAGILKHLRAISAFTYSNDASYERVVDGVWAGSTWVCWGTQNRETPLRSIDGPHFEIKCMDGLANPYLALAAILGAGMQSVEDEEPLTMKDCLEDPASLSAEEREKFGIKEKFPKGIEEALDALEADKGLCEILGPAADVYATVKRAENDMLKEMEPDERRNWLIERY